MKYQPEVYIYTWIFPPQMQHRGGCLGSSGGGFVEELADDCAGTGSRDEGLGGLFSLCSARGLFVRASLASLGRGADKRDKSAPSCLSFCARSCV